MKWLCIFLSIIVFFNSSWAHPVSYKDAYGIMPTIMANRQELELNYSFSNNQAFGVSAIKIEGKDSEYQFLIPRYNQRIFRRNQLDSQLNLYLTAGLGVVDENDSSNPALLTGLQFDYETRRIYTLFLTEHLENNGGRDFWSSRYRLGVAPYLADFEGLHTWLIAQADYNPATMNGVMFSPVVRFFYKNYLLEVGSSLNGQLFMAGIFHF